MNDPTRPSSPAPPQAMTSSKQVLPGPALDRPWGEYTYTAFDTETSGAFPIGSDIVEFGAVKWKDGKIIDGLQFLLKPREPMSDFIIGIHGITNEMVENAPLMKDKVHSIRNFFKDTYLMGHHSAFDLGFIAYEFEKYHLPFLEEPVLCTSLLAQKLINDVENHKLQTLVKALGIDGGAAHRAKDDAKACLEVGLACFHKVGPEATLQEIFKAQEKIYTWPRFSIAALNSQDFKFLIEAVLQKKSIEMVYKKERRTVLPLGIVRSVDGDYFSGICGKDQQRKRFYLNVVREVMVIY